MIGILWAADQIRQKWSREPAVAETAAYLGVPEKEVQKIQSYMQRTVSLIMPIAEDESITLADRQGVTEQLKSENQFLWIQKMNNILACAREVVENDIIYS